MKRILLTQGKVAVVDDADYDWLNHYKWHLLNGYYTYYAVRNITILPSKHSAIIMHRMILNAPNGVEIDHINRNGLDNRRLNLRLCSHSENIRNQRLNHRNTTGFKGVTIARDVPHKPFRARIKVNNRTLCLGYYQMAKEAARAYDRGAATYHREFAMTNKMLGLL